MLYGCNEHGDHCIVVYETKYLPHRCPICQQLKDLYTEIQTIEEITCRKALDKIEAERQREILDDHNTHLERQIEDLKQNQKNDPIKL